jgi:hypothetical protein
MVVQPHNIWGAVAAEWGEKDEFDWRVGVRAACALTKEFARGGCDTVILDVLTNESVALYRQELKEQRPQIVLLLPSYPEVRRRHLERGPEPIGSFMRRQPLAEGFWRLTDADLERLYKHQQQFSAYDLKIDNSDLSSEVVASRLSSWLREGTSGVRSG